MAIEHYQTREIICPYCGHEQMDSWEKRDSADDYECSHCEKEFTYERQVTVFYDSYRKPEDCEHEDQDIYCDHCGSDLMAGVSD